MTSFSCDRIYLLHMYGVVIDVCVCGSRGIDSSGSERNIETSVVWPIVAAASFDHTNK